MTILLIEGVMFCRISQVIYFHGFITRNSVKIMVETT